MIYGVGLDIIELARIERLLLKSDRFEKRILTDEERERLRAYSGRRKVEFAAGRFAAKEAFVKAAGTGISGTYGFQDINISNNSAGKPCLTFPDAAGMRAHVSITHSKEYAAAQVILEKVELSASDF
ncbi:holo-ACP synthase [Bacillus piscicola]|uniref:holo-ACP synthase n=1 Tax=Bacillus piscicola TaxID=1632684 RepID=UPI001F0893BD|nr:holo-ACP synthase [Bacillus piscicola]